MATDIGLGMYKDTQYIGMQTARLQNSVIAVRTMQVHVLPIYYKMINLTHIELDLDNVNVTHADIILSITKAWSGDFWSKVIFYYC